MTYRNEPTTDDLDAEILDRFILAGFGPLEAGSWDHVQDGTLTATDAKVLDYFGHRGWEAWRLENDDAAAWATIARFGEDDGIQIMQITRSGVTIAEARFTYSLQGATWMAAAMNDA